MDDDLGVPPWLRKPPISTAILYLVFFLWFRFQGFWFSISDPHRNSPWQCAIWNHIGWYNSGGEKHIFPVDLSRCLWCDLKTFFKGWFPRCFVSLNTFLMFIFLDVLFLPLPCLCTGGAAPVPKCSFDQNPGFVHGLEADSLRIFPSISGCLTSDASKPLKSSCRLIGKALQRDQRDADLVQGAATGATGKLQEL